MNEKLFLIINYHTPEPLQVFSWLLSELYGVVLFVAIGIVFLLADPKKALARFVIGIIAITISGQLIHHIKKEFREPRPVKHFKHIAVELEDELPFGIDRQFLKFTKENDYPTEGFWIIGKRLRWNSFPSGHAQAAFCAAIAFGMFLRRRWAWISGLLFASCVAWSRIANGVHFPLDVAVGGGVGAAIGWGVLAASKFFYPPAFAPWPKRHSDARLRIAIAAGEASADLYAGNLAKRLIEKLDGVEVYGIGSKNLEASGARLIAHSEELSIMGFTGLLSAFPRIWKLQWRMREEAESNPPRLFIPIDLPDFNLALAKHHRKFGAKVLYFIPPQVWAWRTGRIEKIAKRTDAVCLVLPFEKDCYEGKVPAYFVGHPLTEEIKAELSDDEFWRELARPDKPPIIVLAPGSRAQELRYTLKPLLESARIISYKRPETLFVIPLAPTLNKDLIQAHASALSDLEERLVVFEGRAKELFWRARFGLICSGTATLEAALCGLPHVIMYRAGRINVAIAKRLARVNWIGLPNLIAQKQVVPELIQQDATPQRMAGYALKYLKDENLYNEMKAEFAKIAQALSGKRTYDRVVEIARRLIEDGSAQGKES